MKRCAIACAAFAGAAMALLVAPQAQAQEGGFFGDMLGAIGLTEPARPDIQYRERAPLVVPDRKSVV